MSDELERLRRVVAATEALRDGWRDHVGIHGSLLDIHVAAQYLTAALAAAADAPQPEPPRVRAMTCDHGRTQPHQMLNRFGSYTGIDCPGPSPAVLPEKAEDDD